MSDKPERSALEPAPEPTESAGGAGGTVDEHDAPAVESSAMRALLKRSLAHDADDAPDLLAGVQRRIRARSRGKFFNDGWSTTQARVNYALIGVLTLFLAVLAYYMLSPMGLR
jgi:hypothetical protein